MRSAPADVAPSGRDLRVHVAREKADALAKTRKLSLVLNTLLAISAAALLYLERPDDRLAVWLIAVAAVNLARWAAPRSTRLRRTFGATAEHRLKLSVAGALISGLAWGMLPAALIDFTSVQAPFVCIILCGLTAGAAVQGSAYAGPVVALSAPLLAPVIVKFAVLNSPSGYVLAVDTFVYLCMILRSSRAAEASFTKLAVLRWRADALAVDLRVQNQATQESAERFFRLANSDALTSIANRAAFTKELETRLEEAVLSDGALSLLLLDLDDFKAINDTLGHGAGDEVLRTVARRLESHCSGRCFVARLGGDEFALLLRGDRGEEAAEPFAEGLLSHVGAPLLVREHPVHIRASLGMACFPADAATAEDLLSRADLALYAAKAAGRQAVRRFQPAMQAEAETAQAILRDLPQALEDGSIEVWFQPQVETFDGALVGLEALVRWNHPRLGWTPPPGVVAGALKLRRSEALTRLVLERACAVINRLDQHGLQRVRVSVNVSPREIGCYDLLQLVRDVVSAHGVDPRRLELEITEEAMLAADSSIRTLAAIRAMGVRLVMDDFGTGNSSIAYLRKLRVDLIKIDRSFVAGVSRDDGDRALLKAVVSMGRSLGVEVLAEGVETPEEALVLKSLGCHLAQGFLYGVALNEAELEARLAGERRKPRALDCGQGDGPVLRRLRSSGASGSS